MAMKARDVMTPRVISIEADAAITQAVHLLLQNRISGLPVIDREGELVGMLTGDFIRRGEFGTQRHRSRWLEFLIDPGRLADEYVHARGRKVIDPGGVHRN
jgi:CBS-domain-containing membrane protein